MARLALVPNKEWSSKGRKEEARIRGLDRKDAMADIAERLAELIEEEAA